MKPTLTLLFNHAVPYRTQIIIPVKGKDGFHFNAIDQYFAISKHDEQDASDGRKFYPTIEEAIAAGKRWIDEEIENMRQNFPSDYADVYGEGIFDSKESHTKIILPEYNLADRLERLEHQLTLLQIAADHPNMDTSMLCDELSHGLDLALDEFKALQSLLR